MLTMIETNWPVAAFVLVLGLLVAWLLWGRRGGRARAYAPDVLDEGAGLAQRNQALIDAPSAAATVSLGEKALAAAQLADTGPGLAGVGEALGALAGAGAAPEAQGDDLTRIKGLGPKLRTRLTELGVTRFEQIAAWTEADIATIDAQLGSFAGRSTRDQWVAQAGFLASGDVAGYEAKFGKL
jgi:predicted flap endonuclease-1-like 5' DNA nuclease